MSDDATSGNGAGLSRHLSDEQLNWWIDDQLSPEQRTFVDGHLASCAGCQESLDQLMLFSTMLGDLTQHPVPRSFQLTPEMAGSGQSFWQRITSAMVPLLPAMRAATLVLVLALGGVTLARTIQDDQGNSSVTVPESAMVVTEPLGPTETVLTTVGATSMEEISTSSEAEQVRSDAEFTEPAEENSSEQDRDGEAADSGTDDSGDQDDSSGAGNMSGADASEDDIIESIAMESAPMAADEAEEQTEVVNAVGESASDVSMMKAPDGTPSIPAASPSPIAASPSPQADPSPADLPQSADTNGAEDATRPWASIQLALAGLIGILGVAVVITTRTKRAEARR